MPETDVHKEYIPTECHYFGHKRGTGDLDLAQFIADNGGGGGGGLALESYQNSAMSAAVKAYVYRDVSNNIYRVYEPIRNNDVSRKTFAYIDSIDLVPFDNTNWFNNRFIDLKLINVPVASIIQGCTLEAMIINGGSKTGLSLINSKAEGNYGADATDGAEIYVIGPDVHISGSMFGYNFKLNKIGSTAATTVIQNSYFGIKSYCNVNGALLNIVDSVFDSFSGFDIDSAFTDTCTIYDCKLGYAGYIEFSSGNVTVMSCQFDENSFATVNTNNITRVHLGLSAGVDSTNGSMTDCTVGDNASVSPVSNISDKRFIKIAATTYELGVTAGNVTAT